MVDVTTPIPNGIDIGSLVGGRLLQYAWILDALGNDAVGLNSNSPDPTTILGRLKTISDAIATLDSGDASASNQVTIINGIASLITAINSTTTATQPISAATLPLPNGAATAAGVATIATALAGLLKVDTVVQATATSRSASVGTSASALMAANALRRGFAIQNQSSTAKIYINGTASATADFNSLMIPPLGYYETPPGHTGVGTISIISDTANTPVYAREW